MQKLLEVLTTCSEPVKMSFILLTFTGNITDINLSSPVTYVYTVQMQQEKQTKTQSHPLFFLSETCVKVNKEPVSDKLQQCSESSHRKFLCQNPCDSGNDHRANWISHLKTSLPHNEIHH